MILVDTSIWVDHLRTGNNRLAELLVDGRVLSHPWVIGELALGRLSRRQDVLGLMQALPSATMATPSEILVFVDAHELDGSGLGYVDAGLLAATRLTDGARLWTSDRRLAAAATRFRCAADPTVA